jgi:small subunit ribosomal protein S21
MSRKNGKIIEGLSVEVVNNDINKALRKFKKKVTNDGLIQRVREKEFFEKPTTTRRLAKKAGKKRWQKKMASQQMPKRLY